MSCRARASGTLRPKSPVAATMSDISTDASLSISGGRAFTPQADIGSVPMIVSPMFDQPSPSLSKVADCATARSAPARRAITAQDEEREERPENPQGQVLRRRYYILLRKAGSWTEEAAARLSATVTAGACAALLIPPRQPPPLLTLLRQQPTRPARRLARKEARRCVVQQRATLLARQLAPPWQPGWATDSAFQRGSAWRRAKLSRSALPSAMQRAASDCTRLRQRHFPRRPQT